MAAVVERETEPVRADFGPRLQDDVIFQHAFFADDYLRINAAVLADGYVFADVALRENDRPVADDGTVFNDGVGAYGNVRPQLGRRADDGRGVNAGRIFLLLGVHVFHQQNKRPFRVFGVQQRPLEGERLAFGGLGCDEHGSF